MGPVAFRALDDRFPLRAPPFRLASDQTCIVTLIGAKTARSGGDASKSLLRSAIQTFSKNRLSPLDRWMVHPLSSFSM
jgi:hypothetical protein